MSDIQEDVRANAAPPPHRHGRGILGRSIPSIRSALKELPKCMPLHDAIIAGDLDRARELIAQGVSVDATNGSRGWTALYTAASARNTDIARFLIDHGALVSVRAFRGNAPIHRAVRSGCMDIVQLLIDRGQLEARGCQNQTPLQMAVAHGDEYMARYLAEQGAPFDVVDENGATLLHSATNTGRLQLVRWILKRGIPVNARDCAGRTALHTENLSADIARVLLEHGADPQATDLTGATPLHVTITENHVETARLLLAYGAQVDAMDERGWTPLHCTAGMGVNAEEEFLRVLLDHGANVNAVAPNGWTPLHIAVQAVVAYSEVALTLIEYGAQVNAEDAEGRTPLHVAVPNGGGGVIQVLLQRGADVNARTKQGWSVLTYAMLKSEFGGVIWPGFLNCLRLLSAVGATYDMDEDHLVVSRYGKQNTASLRACLEQWMQQRAWGRGETMQRADENASDQFDQALAQLSEVPPDLCMSVNAINAFFEAKMARPREVTVLGCLQRRFDLGPLDRNVLQQIFEFVCSHEY